LASAGGRIVGLGEGKLWNLADGTQRCPLDGITGRFLDLAFAPDGQTLATAGADMVIRLWSADDGKQRTAWRAHTKEITFIRFTPDGKLLVSAAVDNTLRLWDPSTGQRLASLYDPYGERGTGELLAVAISPDGRRIATGRIDGRIKLWSIEDLLPGDRTPLLAKRTPLYKPSDLDVYVVGPVDPNPLLHRRGRLKR
jgi:WD40 repeat protein